MVLIAVEAEDDREPVAEPGLAIAFEEQASPALAIGLPGLIDRKAVIELLRPCASEGG